MTEPLARWLGKSLYAADVPDLQAATALPAGPFVLFVAADARARSEQELRVFARRLLEAGAAAVATWGPECERLHDAFDLENLESAVRRGFVMTTWHAGDPLDEALWFAATALTPDEGFGHVDTFVAIAVGNGEWAERIAHRLRDPETLDELL